MKFLIIVEPTETGFSAYSPDIEGCVATGETKEEVKQTMQEAIQFHLEGLQLENLALPEAKASFFEVEIFS